MTVPPARTWSRNEHRNPPGRDEATGPAPAEPAIEERTEAELRTLLGLGPVDHEMVVATRLGNSFVDGLVQVIGALLRLVGLKKGPPRAPRLRRWFTSVVTWIIAELIRLPGLFWDMPRAVRVRGWIVTGVVGVIAALLRLIGLNHPKTLMFDEIYYVKDAYSLWRLGYEGSWKDNADAAFAIGDFSKLTDNAAYVVHPQLASGSSAPAWRSSGRPRPSAGGSCRPSPGSSR